MAEDLGFLFVARRGGEVVITHRGTLAATLRGDRAQAFLADMDGLDPASQQQEMARLTGNYKRGNERLAKKHPRNA
jgi:hypothetical protein